MKQATKKEMKQHATELLQRLDVHKDYVSDFRDKGIVCLYEDYGGYWAFQEPEVQAKIAQIEEKYDVVVYAVTHEYTGFGECYDFLIVTQYGTDRDDEFEQIGNNTFYAYAYVWNRDEEAFSEFGPVTVRSFGGGIGRIG